jgi:hypothetical protein
MRNEGNSQQRIRIQILGFLKDKNNILLHLVKFGGLKDFLNRVPRFFLMEQG